MAGALRMPKTFSPDQMVADLRALDDERWRAVIPRKGAEWSGVALRSHDGRVETLGYAPGVYRDTQVLAEMPYFREVVQFFECDLCRVRLLSMRPGTRIGEHIDALPGDQADQVRLHVPVLTNPGVIFHVEGEPIRMGVGELWYLDVSRRHRVANEGSEARIHLVVDCRINTWLEGLMAASTPH